MKVPWDVLRLSLLPGGNRKWEQKSKMAGTSFGTLLGSRFNHFAEVTAKNCCMACVEQGIWLAFIASFRVAVAFCFFTAVKRY